MEIAKNQKGFSKLSMNDQLWNSIQHNDNKLIVVYGSNGMGKSTIKDLIQKENLNKNFLLPNVIQTNELYSSFGQNKFMIYDEDFINGFVYSNDKIHKNKLKILVKTADVERMINDKKAMNQTISTIINISTSFLGKIDSIEKTINIKTTGNVTVPQKRFASSFIIGTLPSKYEDIFDINDELHKTWWYEGLSIYKKNNLTYCPWCKCQHNIFAEEVKNQIDAVDEVNGFDTKVFDDKKQKTTSLLSLKADNVLANQTIEAIDAVVSNISDSADTNKENELVSQMKDLRSKLDNDREILEEVIDKVKYIDNILDVETTDLENKLQSLMFFKTTDEQIQILNTKIDEFINTNTTIVENIKNSNQQLIESLGNSEIQINKILNNLGLKYVISIDCNKVISNGINEDSEYIFLKSKNGIDISNIIGSTLSYGEKSTLAFAIFIQQIINNADLNTIIIFDDPISSYDLFRRFTTISILRSLKDVDYKKIIMLTHESSFLLSIINNFRKATNINMKPLLLNQTSEDNIELVEINDTYGSEVNVYKEMLNIANNNIHLCQRVLAIRQLHDLYRFMTGKPPLNVYNYICKLIHYRKDENKIWNQSFINDLKTIFDYFGITYDSSIEQIQDSNIVYRDIDLLLNELTLKDVYSVTLEDLCSFRMIAECAIRNESTLVKRYKEKTLWEITDSSKEKSLENYQALLNSLCHIDDDEVAWPQLCIEDLKAVPKAVISDILNILR